MQVSILTICEAKSFKRLGFMFLAIDLWMAMTVAIAIANVVLN
ncbi:4799_t:CDS:2 [Ambispora leptoticha]|uniref:4799_t:CDS:1 n=1 Tax=Ambispora leptoticha TaxID=144679 RepID=A0A9N9B847_9GLOM|nr:4799_t:CDS:2 [Ambispora leptoticha]